MMIVWIVAHHHELSTAQAMIDDIARQDDQLRVHAARKAALEVERARLEEHDRLVAQLSRRTHMAVVLADLSRRLPESMMLTTVRIVSPGLVRYVLPPDPQPSIGERSAAAAPRSAAPAAATAVPPETTRPQLEMTGVARSAPDVIRFAAQLEGSPLFDRVQIQSQGAAQWAGRRVEKFEITCDLFEPREAAP